MQVDNTTDDKHVIDWRIQNFSSCLLTKFEKLECAASTAGNLFNTIWVFGIFPKGQPKHDPTYLACSLKRKEDKVGPEKIHIEFEFSVLTFDGVAKFKKSGREEFKRGDAFGFPYFIKREEIYRLKEFFLHYDTLRVRCKLRLLPPKEKQTSLQTFLTRYQTEVIPAQMNLNNFRGISKQDPMTLSIKGTNDLLELYVSMNKDNTSGDQIQEEAVENENEAMPESYLHMVMMKKKCDQRVHVSCDIKLLDKKLEIAIEREFSHLFEKINEKEKWVLPHFIDTNKLGNDCIDDGKLYLDLNFKICNDQPSPQQNGDFTPLKLQDDPKEDTWKNDLVDLHEDKTFSDVTLRVGDETFPAHKNILAKRSPKFHEIFKRLMAEKANPENHIVELDDIDKETMKVMLKFIYTNELEDLDDERCLLLYSAAQKYQISSLQFKCARTFRENLTIKTVYKLLLIAEEFKDTELKIIALDYFVNNYEYVLLTPEWQAFTEEHEELSGQVMRHIRLKKQQLDD